jgi:hypothetical protein
MSALPPYPGPSGINNWNTPYHVGLSAYAGETVDIAWHAVDGDGNGLWYPWAIDDCSIGADDHFIPVLQDPGASAVTGHAAGTSSGLVGYDIYRRDGNSGGFAKINAAPVADTTYQDQGLASGQYRYFIQSIFAECQNSTNSDTLLVDLITSAGFSPGPGIRVFPNPASGHVTLDADSPLVAVRLYTVEGTCAESWNGFNSKRMILDTHELARGIYILKVQMKDGARNFKISLVGD